MIVVIDHHSRPGDGGLFRGMISRVDAEVCEVAVLEKSTSHSHDPRRVGTTDTVAAELMHLDVLEDGFARMSVTVGVAVRIKSDPGDTRSTRRPAVSVDERAVSPHDRSHDSVDTVGIPTARIEKLSRPAVTLGEVPGPLNVTDKPAIVCTNSDRYQLIVGVECEVVQ
ncbi:hypothetical protein C468_16500 [Halorubrum kocurii JCM 14978]|uniref:Uncharacterized protein n=1 Tax=Halorubrum kocurii JCM 14978 TaxID=1230456 RepID=M0NIQ8_9EURY|nr:hypothetical protein C468_16500 [Halorubrum kocurii JCM 14978]